uniref:Uncharacterized protein n=1 Tax=Parastrongyloides trichosuri TaxID=131310 RepID=A0A0N5A6G2_PARTI
MKTAGASHTASTATNTAVCAAGQCKYKYCIAGAAIVGLGLMVYYYYSTKPASNEENTGAKESSKGKKSTTDTPSDSKNSTKGN